MRTEYLRRFGYLLWASLIALVACQAHVALVLWFVSLTVRHLFRLAPIVVGLLLLSGVPAPPNLQRVRSVFWFRLCCLSLFIACVRAQWKPLVVLSFPPLCYAYNAALDAAGLTTPWFSAYLFPIALHVLRVCAPLCAVASILRAAYDFGPMRMQLVRVIAISCVLTQGLQPSVCFVTSARSL
jgi:hypothetical protein